MEKVVLWGTSKITDILEYYLVDEKYCEVCAYTLDKKYISNNYYKGKPVIPFEEIEKYFLPSEVKLAFLMSPRNNNKIREDKYVEAKAKGYSFITYISKYAQCATKDIGENVFIFPQVCILPFVTIKNNICIWSGTAIGHDSIIEDNCYLAGAKLAGFTQLGKNCFLGTNCSISDHVKIGAYSIIGNGSIVLKNIPDASVLVCKQTPIQALSSFELEGLIN